MPSNISDLLQTKSKKIPLNVPELTGQEWNYVKECFDTGWVSTSGPHVTKFENQFAKVVGAPFAVAMASGTAALHMALMSIGVENNDAVITSNLTFVAPSNAIRYCGAWPIFMDADPKTWQMDVKKLATFLATECDSSGSQCTHKKSGRRIRAILPVHILGLSCEMEIILDLARRNHLLVVEDAAEGLGVKYHDQQVGTFGDVGIFSFNGNKIITAGGGGMVVTRNEERAKYARYLSTQAKDDEIEYFHKEIGFNYRLNNLQAAMGLAQLEALPDFIRKKRKIAETYTAAFSRVSALTTMPSMESVSSTHWLYTILLPDNFSLEERKRFIRELTQEGVEARPFWHPLGSLPPFKKCDSFQLDVSDRLYRRGVCLPSSVGLKEDDQQFCIDVVLKTLTSFKK